VIVDGIWNEDLVDYTDEDAAIKEAKRAIAELVAIETSVDDAVRAKISSLKKSVHEGSREYEVLYKKYYEEELAKKGR
jgi:hypothetical protein